LIIYKIDYIQKGKVKSVYLKASSAFDALKIFKRKYKGIIREIHEIEKPSLIEEFEKKVFEKRVNLEELIAIFDQMYVMLDAGISIDMVLSQTIVGIKDKHLKRIFEDIYHKINSGQSLYESFKIHEDELGIIVTAMVSLGEQSGDLAEAFSSLIQILSEINENRKRFKKATRYPIFIIFAMIIAFTIVILFVIPPFKSIYAQMGANLPLPTRFLLWIEGAIEHYGLMILSIILVVFGIMNYLYKTKEKVKLLIDKYMLKIYILGKVIKLAMLGRFVFVFNSLINSGIPIVTSIDIALSIVENEYMKKRLILIKDEIEKGGKVSQGFENTKLFDPMIVQMVNAGEESGNLTKMFEKISDYYLREYRYIVDNISVLIEPILIAAIAGFVFTLALGIFLPMWNLTEAVK